MSRLPDFERLPWLGGALTLAASAAVAGALGLVLHLRSWPVYLGLALTLLLFMGGSSVLAQSPPRAPPPRARGRLKVIRAASPITTSRRTIRPTRSDG